MTTPSLTCDAFDALLPDWLEGTLDDADRAAAEAHLGSCVRCRGLLQDLERIRDDAAQLPELAPSRDLWSAIDARIASPVTPLHRAGAAPAQRPAWRRQAIAAAAILAVGVGGTWLAMRPGTGRTIEVATNPGTTVAPTPTPNPVIRDSGLTAVATIPGQPRAPRAQLAANRKKSVEETTSLEVTRLEQVLAERRSELDPKTVAVIDSNLAIIDKAIRDAKRALKQDPKSAFLEEQFSTILGQKVELMRRAALLPSRT